MGEKRRFMAVVSGALASRELGQLVRGPENAHEFTFPRASTEAFDSAFRTAEKLQRVVLGKRLETIGNACFQFLGLRVLKIPQHVRTIKRSAFADCSKLSVLAFSKNAKLEEIGPEAFRETNLRVLVAPESLRTIGSESFYGC